MQRPARLAGNPHRAAVPLVGHVIGRTSGGRIHDWIAFFTGRLINRVTQIKVFKLDRRINIHLIKAKDRLGIDPPHRQIIGRVFAGKHDALHLAARRIIGNRPFTIFIKPATWAGWREINVFPGPIDFRTPFGRDFQDRSRTARIIELVKRAIDGDLATIGKAHDLIHGQWSMQLRVVGCLGWGQKGDQAVRERGPTDDCVTGFTKSLGQRVIVIRPWCIIQVRPRITNDRHLGPTGNIIVPIGFKSRQFVFHTKLFVILGCLMGGRRKSGKGCAHFRSPGSRL